MNESHEIKIPDQVETKEEVQARFDKEKPDKHKRLLFKFKTQSVTTIGSAGRGRMSRTHPLWKEVWNSNRDKYGKSPRCGGTQECARRKKKMDEGKTRYVQHWDYDDFKRVRRVST